MMMVMMLILTINDEHADETTLLFLRVSMSHHFPVKCVNLDNGWEPLRDPALCFSSLFRRIFTLEFA